MLAGKLNQQALKPWFWLDQSEVKLHISGLPTNHDQIAKRSGAGKRCHFAMMRSSSRPVAEDRLSRGVPVPNC
ncbi:oxidoreductase C-terminal domain-containing protein [uncultured Roseobacter sp.]|uniref:oxidoreductase C-terminal domain-containing protein n=1 Tax=uncultured Roseobacter sp. TaxID=114847 RepID=UPI00344E4289